MLVDFAKNLAGLANSNYIGGQVLRHHAACANDDIIANTDPRENDHISANPTVFSNMHRRIILIALLCVLRRRATGSDITISPSPKRW